MGDTDMGAERVRAVVLDGKAMAAQLRAEAGRDLRALGERGVTAGLAVLLVGDDPASAVYVRNKVKACEELGIRSRLHTLPASASEDEVLGVVDSWNADPAIDGILVQLPLPPQVTPARVVDRIDPAKDVDGFHPCNLGLLAAGRPRLVACTPAGVMRMLATYGKAYGWTPAGKRAVVIGRSLTVGRPMALLLTQADATVTLCHSRTADLAGHVRQADVVIAAAGSPKLVQGGWIKPGAVVIDVGIHRDASGALCGDVDFEGAQWRAAAISPVPGGVGPMTIAQLMRNTADACARRAQAHGNGAPTGN